VCMGVCVCVRERERQREVFVCLCERENNVIFFGNILSLQPGRGGGRECVYVCLCVRVCARAREKERVCD